MTGTTINGTHYATPAALALTRLREVHPHHVDRLRSNAASMVEGTPVTFTGRGEFYTGIRTGTTVIVTREPVDSYGSLSVQRTDVGAHLSTTTREVETLTLDRWTSDEAKAGANAAEVAATAMLEKAYTAANGLIGAPHSGEYALLCLTNARDLRLYAFALRVYADYIRTAECEVTSFIPA